MNDTNILLNEIYKTASMGANSLDALIPETRDSEIKQTLRSQLDSYHEFLDQTSGCMILSGQTPKEPSVMNKLFLDMNVKMNAKMDKSTSHVAEMMIQGTNMGIIELEKAMNHATDADPKATKLAKDLIKFEQKTIDAYKDFL